MFEHGIAVMEQAVVLAERGASQSTGQDLERGGGAPQDPAVRRMAGERPRAPRGLRECGPSRSRGRGDRRASPPGRANRRAPGRRGRATDGRPRGPRASRGPSARRGTPPAAAPGPSRRSSGRSAPRPTRPSRGPSGSGASRGRTPAGWPRRGARRAQGEERLDGFASRERPLGEVGQDDERGSGTLDLADRGHPDRARPRRRAGYFQLEDERLDLGGRTPTSVHGGSPRPSRSRTSAWSSRASRS